MALNNKQKRFCDEYLIDFNATQAAIRAGYSSKTARSLGAENLSKPDIQEYIKAKQQKVSLKLDISQERVLKELAAIAFSDIRNYYDENSLLKSVKDFDDNSAAALAGIEVDQLWGSSIDGKIQIGETKKLKRWDKVKALEIINKMLGYNAPDQSEVSIKQPFSETQVDKIINALRGNR